MSLCLTGAELRDLTGLERPSYQARELDHLGIPYRARRDGTLAVLRIHVEVVPPGATLRPEPKVRLPV